MFQVSHEKFRENALLVKGGTLLPGEGNGTPLQGSCLEKPVDGGAW